MSFFSFLERTSGVAFFTISSSLKDKSSLQHFPVFLDEKGLMTVFFRKCFALSAFSRNEHLLIYELSIDFLKKSLSDFKVL